LKTNSREIDNIGNSCQDLIRKLRRRSTRARRVLQPSRDSDTEPPGAFSFRGHVHLCQTCPGLCGKSDPPGGHSHSHPLATLRHRLLCCFSLQFNSKQKEKISLSPTVEEVVGLASISAQVGACGYRAVLQMRKPMPNNISFGLPKLVPRNAHAKFDG
jgi:hypothetical protein